MARFGLNCDRLGAGNSFIEAAIIATLMCAKLAKRAWDWMCVRE